MSEEQLSALLAKLKDESGLREKLKSAIGLDAAVGFAQEAGFVVRKAAWLRYQAKPMMQLSDEKLGGSCRNWTRGQQRPNAHRCASPS